MKRAKVLFFLLLVIAPFISNAATITSTGTGGNWNAGGSWVGGIAPTLLDDVIIASGATITVTASTTCLSLTINGSGILSFNTNTVTLNVTNALTLNGTSQVTGTGTARALTVGSLSVPASTTPSLSVQTFTNNGASSIIGNLTVGSDTGIKTFIGSVNNSGTWNSTAIATTGNMVFRGGISNSGTFTAGSATFSTSAQALSGSSSMSFANTVTVTGITLTNNNTGTVSMTNAGAGSLTGTGGFTQGTNSTLAYTGSTITITTFTPTGSGNTVNYNGGAQTVFNAGTYTNLTLSGSGAKTLQAATTSITGNFALSGTATATTVVGLSVGGNLSVGNGTTLTEAGFNFSVTGTSTIGAGTSGQITFSSNTGTKTFTGLVTLNAGSTWTSTALTTSGNLIFQGGIANSGTFSAGGATFNTNAQALSGSSSMSFANTVTVTGIALTNNNTGTVSMTNSAAGSLTGTGGFTQGTNSTLAYTGSTITITTFTPTGSGNTVNYNGGAQTVFNAGTYTNLTLSGSGTKTLQAATTSITGNFVLSGTAATTTVVGLSVGGNLSVGNGTTLTVAGFNFSVTGTSTIGAGTSGQISFSSNTGTKTFTGLVTMNAGSTWTSTTLTTTANLIFQGGIANSGTFSAGGATFNTNSQSLTGASALSFANNVAITGATLTASNTGNLTITGTTTLSTSGGFTNNNNTSVTTLVGNVSVGASTSFTSTSVTTTGNLVFRGGIANSGTFTAGGATFNTNAQALTGSSNMSFANTVTVTAITVTNNNTGTVSLTNAAAGSLTGTGTFTQGTNANLSYAGASMGITTLSATASGNTVNYNGTTQTVFSTNYTNLTLSNSGTKTLQTGTTAIGGNLTLSGTASTTTVVGLAITGNLAIGDGTTFTAAGFNLTVTGSTTVGGGTSGQINFSSTAGTKTFTGGVSIGAGGNWNNTASTAVTIGAGLSVGSSATFTQGTGLVTFTGASSNTVSSVNTTLAFGGGITVNKGASQANVLDVTAPITMLIGGLTLTNGTFKLSNASSSITPFTADPNLTASTQLWCNGGTMLAGSNSLTTAGAIQVSAGILNVGTSTNNFLYINGGSLTVSGGSVTVTGPLSDSPSPFLFGNGMNFNMSGGTITVNTAVGTSVDYPFYIDSGFGSQFNMSGGTLVIQASADASGFGGSTTAGYFNHVTGGTFTGGTIQIGNSNTAASSTIEIDTTIPIYNLTVNSSNVTARIANQAITVSNNVTISSGTLNPNGFNTTVGGNWTNNGTFSAGTTTVTLNGTAQAINGSSLTFYDLALSGSGTKTFSSSVAISHNLSIATGVVANLGSITTHTTQTLTLGGNNQAGGSWGSTSSSATNQNNTFFTAGTTGIINASGRTYYSRQTGNWNSATTWSTVTYGNATNTGTFPVAGDDVLIGGGNFTITVNVASACTSLTYQSNATNSPTVSLNSGISLNVSGAITIPRASATNPDVNTLAVGAGTLTAGSLAFTNSGTNQRHVLSISTGTATITGNVTTDGTSTSPTITFTSSGTLNVGGTFLNSTNCSFTRGTGTVNYNGAAQTVGDFSYYNLTLSGSGVKDMASLSVSTINNNFVMSGTASTAPSVALTIGGSVTLGSGTSFTAGALTHNVAGNWTNNGASFTNTNSTINFNGTTTQTIGGSSATTFNNMTLSGTNTVSFSLSTTISSTLTQNTGTVINPNSITTHTARTYIRGGTAQAPGTYGSTSSAATNQSNTFFTAATTGILTITNRIYYSRQTGNWNSSTTWSTVTYGNATNLGTFPVAGDDANIGGGSFTITVNVNSACATLSYQSNATNSPTVSISSGISLTVSGAVTIPRASGTNPDINTLAVGAGTLTAGSLAFTNSGTNQRHVLTISTGTATITGSVTTDGTSTSPTITFTGSGLLQVGGSMLTSTTCSFTPSTGTVEYNGTSAQNVSDLTYYNLKFNNTSSTIPQLSLIANTTATNGLIMTSGVVNLAGFTLTLGSTGVASTLTRTTSSTTNWLYNGTFSRNWVNATAITSTSGNFYGLFPMGTSSASSYRPLEVNSTASPTASGTYNVTHTNNSGSLDLVPTFSDAGTTVQRIDNSQFVGATSGVTGGTYNLSITMTGLNSTGVLSDIRLAVFNGGTTATAVGTHTATTGSVSNPTAGRTGLSLTNLSNDFRIATINSSATPLPIHLISFTALVQADVVNLQWTTASEFNNDFFTVQRSATGEKFEDVIRVSGKGTTTEQSKYEAIDPSPLYGTSYYRLKQTDFDGNTTYSKVVFVQNDSPGIRFSVYPNPAFDKKLTVELSGMPADSNVPVRVVNMIGSNVLTAFVRTDGNGSAKALVDLSSHANGVYLVIVNAQTGLQRKVIIE